MFFDFVSQIRHKNKLFKIFMPIKKTIFSIKLLIFLFLIPACLTSGFIKSDAEIKSENPILVFEQTKKACLYKTEINLYKNYFSGITVIKRIDKKSYRIVFMNETGMKFFDFEINSDNYKIHHIFKPMNKKVFVKLLINDYRNLLMTNFNQKEAKKYLTKNKKNIVIKTDKKKILYFFDLKTGLPEKAEQYSLFRKIVTINYSEYKNNLPEKIKIIHKNIKFTMKLSKFKQ